MELHGRQARSPFFCMTITTALLLVGIKLLCLWRLTDPPLNECVGFAANTVLFVYGIEVFLLAFISIMSLWFYLIKVPWWFEMHLYTFFMWCGVVALINTSAMYISHLEVVRCWAKSLQV